ncbi:hypothetical protein [Halorubrum halodurans]|uniref:Uncharacterized protein n=1 Tax=Halorubrum halodurans TaxID=1383851 RepID=A0A256IK29_9EURY|nr:hypothetical protein [Halorubrum halodurans]OYR56666.1 hypothetical protein DJ70_08090 [Halorubrum halodurans]
MTQYFKFINETRKEVIAPDTSSMEAVARVTDPVGTGILAYLLIDGPKDGTRFTDLVNPHAPEFEDAMSEFMADEREATRNEGRTSIYRNDDGSWNRERIVECIAADQHVTEGTEYAGRWAGDDIRLVGDYEESGVYDDTTEEWVYEHETGEFVAPATGSGPIDPASLDDTTIVHSIEDRDVLPGDLCAVRHPETGNRVYAEFKRVADTEWTDITDGVMREFEAFVGRDWVESQAGASRIRPGMVLSVDEDGNAAVHEGAEATAVIERSDPDDGSEVPGRDTSLDEFRS